MPRVHDGFLQSHGGRGGAGELRQLPRILAQPEVGPNCFFQDLFVEPFIVLSTEKRGNQDCCTEAQNRGGGYHEFMLSGAWSARVAAVV